MNSISKITLPGGASAPDFSHGSIYFIGTATVIIRYAGFTILTDPNFIHRHEKVDLGGGIQATRQTDPAMEIGDLPPIDLIVLSHFHGDHFDRVAIAELNKSIPIVTTPHAGKELRERGFLVITELDPWTTVTFFKGGARLNITATPGRHGPPVTSFVLPDVMGSILDFWVGEEERETITDRRLRMYITGDTLVYNDIKEIPQRFPGVDLALLHLGGTKVMGILLTMDADQGMEMMKIIQPKTAIPIHYNDYDVFKSPIEDFRQAVHAAGLGTKVKFLNHGDTFEFKV